MSNFYTGGSNVQAKLQTLYLSWINDYLTVQKFAEDHSILIEDAETIINLGREAHEGIVRRMSDECYEVVHAFMGAGMHNYQINFNGKQIACRLTESDAWAACEEHHIEELTLRAFDNRI